MLLKLQIKAAQEINLNLLGVSVLTSFSDEDLESLGFKNKVEDQVKKLIKLQWKLTYMVLFVAHLRLK